MFSLFLPYVWTYPKQNVLKKTCRLVHWKRSMHRRQRKWVLYQFRHLRMEILSSLPSHSAIRNRRMQKAQEHRGQPLFLLRELPRVMGRSRQWRKGCCWHHVVRRDFRQSLSQLKNPSIHIQRWHMFYSVWPEGNSFLHRLLDLHIKKKKKKVETRCKTRKRVTIRKATKDVWLLNFD